MCWIEVKSVAERAIASWENFVEVISYWEGLCKSSGPPVNPKLGGLFRGSF